MSADFLFSFLLFFQVQIDSIRQSGFYQLIEEKYPLVGEGIKEFQSDSEVQEFLELTGLDSKDLISLSLTLEGLDEVSKLIGNKKTPKIGVEIELLGKAQIRGDLNEVDLISFILNKLEEEKGEEERKNVERTQEIKGDTTYLTLPKEIMDAQTVGSDLLLAIKKGKKNSELIFGNPKLVRAAHIGKEELLPLSSLDFLSESRNITLATKIDPELWNRPEFGANPDNPLFAGLTSTIKGIREFGFSISFFEETMDFEVCINCKDKESALGLWTVVQGGLGMAQLATAQQGGQIPSLVTRIKTEAIEENVFVRMEVLPSDLDELSKQLMPPRQEPISHEIDPLEGNEAPVIESKYLNGESFILSDQKGKVVVLDFWATWCGPCVKALPELIKMNASFSRDKVSLIAVNQGESEDTISLFLKKMKFEDLNVVLDQNQMIGRNFRVQGIPQTVVIDKNGIVRHVHVGFSSNLGILLKNEIDSLLQE